MLTFATSALLLGLAIAAPANFRSPRAACATGIHMIIARASTEPAGEGIIGLVAMDIKEQIPGSDAEAVDYPATLDSLENYISSESQGVAAMTKLVQDYVDICPDSKIVLLGYSQGAQVAFDVLCGTSEADFTPTEPLASNYGKNILAVIAMGDPSFIHGLSYDVGNATNQSYFPRQDTDACSPYADSMQSYCDYNDKYCDSGNSTDVHTGYLAEYGMAATTFVVNKYEAST